ncbi:Peptidyl-prolyl cis-trans isomerase FKBP53 [Platanthera guangdongensis]|uniref:peptidylprolyl isomerase n=1 Tax=Platanthera guangdongensis TaxID=2320717 RepID=A0ABR2LQ34_9ASPA
MTFWGVEIRPGKPYIHSFDQSRGRLRISQATLGDGKSESKSTGQCIVGNSSPVSLCTLIPNVSETCHLELEFEEDKEVTFSVLGPRSIHLTGYYPGHVGRLNGDDSESYGEDISESDTSDSCGDGSEDEYESDFIDDDDDLVYANFPGKKSSVVIEEIKDDDKSCDKNYKLHRVKKKHVVCDSEDAVTGSKQLAVMNKGSTKVESEDEDGFPIFFTPISSSKKKIIDDNKSKTDGTSQVTVSTSEAKENLNSTAPAETVTENKVKSKKKKKNNDARFIVTENDKKQNKSNENAKVEEKSETDANISLGQSGEPIKESINGAQDTDNDGVSFPVTSGGPDTCKVIKKHNKKKRTREEGISDGNDLCKDKIDLDKLPQDDCMPIDMKKKSKKNKKKNSDSDINHVTSAKEKADLIDGVDSQHGSQSNKTRTYPNGLIVEEVSMGNPEGKKATPGKKVSMHYIGKLKNGTIFDSNIGQRPFKFRLGIGEVIKGWDLGVNGMRVGDKRRLTIPPSFGYGTKNMGKIPPNSWLLFDVELVDVQ